MVLPCSLKIWSIWGPMGPIELQQWDLTGHRLWNWGAIRRGNQVETNFPSDASHPISWKKHIQWIDDPLAMKSVAFSFFSIYIFLFCNFCSYSMTFFFWSGRLLFCLGCLIFVHFIWNLKQNFVLFVNPYIQYKVMFLWGPRFWKVDIALGCFPTTI